MPLPTRDYYTIEDAAEKLGCTAGDIRYHLEVGHLRYAIEVDKLELFIFADGRLLPGMDWGELRCLKTIYDEKSPVIPFLSLKANHIVGLKYLYVRHTDLLSYPIIKSKIAAHYLETFDEVEVTLWDFIDPDNEPDRPEPFYVLGSKTIGTLDDKGFLSPCKISLEDMNRFSGDDNPEELPVIQLQKVNELPFNEPSKTNEIAILMCKFGNRYIKEFGEKPTKSQLLTYMLNNPDQTGLVRTTVRDEYLINEEPISKRKFGDRYKIYTK